MERNHIGAIEDAVATLEGCRKLLVLAIPEQDAAADELNAIAYAMEKAIADIDEAIGELIKEVPAEGQL